MSAYFLFDPASLIWAWCQQWLYQHALPVTGDNIVFALIQQIMHTQGLNVQAMSFGGL